MSFSRLLFCFVLILFLFTSSFLTVTCTTLYAHTRFSPMTRFIYFVEY